MDYDRVRFTAIEEMRALLEAVDAGQAGRFVRALGAARSVFTAGAGRSGLAMRGFAMRLMHLGMMAHVVGDMVTPPFQAGDLLVIGSGSGATPSLASMAEKAKSLGGTVALVTAASPSQIERRADVFVLLPAPTPKNASAGRAASRQPMASLFEQALWVFLDSCIMMLMEDRGASSDGMFGRHANLE